MPDIFSSYVKYLQKNNVSLGTILQKRSILARFERECLDGRRLAALDSESIDAWLETLKLAPSTLAHYVVEVRTFFRFCVKTRQLVKNPAAHLRVHRPRPKKKFLPPVDRLLQDLLPHCHTLYEQTIFLTLVYTGMRIGELSRLRWSDYNERDRVLTVKGKKKPSSAELYELRYVAIPQPLACFFRFSRNGTDEVLPGSQHHAWMVLRRIVRRADPPYRVHPHLFRAVYITHMLEQGVDVKTISENTGNSPEVLLRHYAFPSQTAIGKAVDRAFGKN